MRFYMAGIFTGKNGMMLVMLITSVVLIWMALMALRFRVAIIRSLSEASSSILNRFVLSEGSGGGGGSASISASGSGSGGGGGGGGGSDGGGGAVRNTVASTTQAMGATAGSTLAKAALTGGAAAGGSALAGTLMGNKNEHSSVATGDGTSGNYGVDAEVSGTVDAPSGKDAQVSARAGDASAGGAATGSGMQGSSLLSASEQEQLDKRKGSSLMEAASLASVTDVKQAKTGEAGPESGRSVSEELSSRFVSSAEAGPASGMSVGEAAAYASGAESVSGSTKDTQVRGVRAEGSEGYLSLSADGRMQSEASSQSQLQKSGGVRGVQVPAGEAGEPGTGRNLERDSARESAEASVRGVSGMKSESESQRQRGLSVGQVAAGVRGSSDMSQREEFSSREQKGQYRQGSEGSLRGMQASQNVNVRVPAGAGGQGGTGRPGLGGMPSRGTDSKTGSYRRGSSLVSSGRYAMPGMGSSSANASAKSGGGPGAGSYLQQRPEASRDAGRTPDAPSYDPSAESAGMRSVDLGSSGLRVRTGGRPGEFGNRREQRTGNYRRGSDRFV